MTDRPSPLVGADVDLRDFAFMPLDVVRLRDSGLTAKASGDEFRAAVLLWCASWHQQPAASLPNDDDELANLCGYGRAMREWAKVRVGALRGWVECSDGRLYHPTVATKAREAWQSKLAHRARTEAARKAREEQRQRMSQGLSQSLSQTPQVSVTEDVTESKGQGQGQGQGQGLWNTATSDEVAPHRPSPADGPQLTLVEPIDPKPPGIPECPHLAILELWAEVLPEMPQHLPGQWKGSRADHLRARWRETAKAKGWQSQADGFAYFRRLFAYVGQSAFLTGRVTPQPGRPPFQVRLAWLVEPSNWAKVVEGDYHRDAA